MGIFSNMQARGIWRGYNRQIVGIEPILQAMSDRGMPVNPEAFAGVEATLIGAMAKAKGEMQALIPDGIRKFKDYKKTPKKLEGCVEVEPGKWRRYAEWKPSNQGLLAYIRNAGHRVPKNFKTGKETTEALEIKRLEKETHDPLYRKVLEYRKAQTILDNHIENWRPGADGRVHSTFYYDPATGQFSSRRPNVQNAPKHDDPEYGGFAKVFRSMIRASEGHTIVEFDFKSFHAQTLAFESSDPDYLRLAKLDIHSYLAAHLVRHPDAAKCLAWDDEKLGAFLAQIKKQHKFVRDYKAKRAILGYGFGMGWKKLYEMNKESFDSQADAKHTLAMLDRVFPVTKAWRDEIRQKAHEQGFLISRHGYIRYFWEVFTWKNGWTPGGEDSEAAIAFLPANDAFGEMRDRMIEIYEKGLDKRYGMINNIHDSLLFECPNALVEEAAGTIKAIMERPSTVLLDPRVAPNGLFVEVDVQAGPDWANMKGLK